MNHIQRIVFSIVFLVPISAFAHGQDVFGTLYIQLASIIIFLIIVIAIKINLKRKLILMGMYILALLATEYLIYDWPYRENILKINLLVNLVPAFAFLITLLLLKSRTKE